MGVGMSLDGNYSSKDLARAVWLAARGHEERNPAETGMALVRPMRLMAALVDRFHSNRLGIVGALSRSLADRYLDPEDIRANFPPEILRDVEALTQGDKESYAAFVDRCRSNPIAATALILDIEGSLADLDSLSLDETDPLRAAALRRQYFRALGRLLDAFSDSDAVRRALGLPADREAELPRREPEARRIGNGRAEVSASASAGGEARAGGFAAGAEAEAETAPAAEIEFQEAALCV